MKRAPGLRLPFVLLAGLSLLRVAPAAAATITLINADGAGEGFNDPTPVAQVVGNAGTTLGQQRLNVMAAAAAYWSNRLSSPVPITVSAQMDPLACSPGSGILGAAGADSYFANFPNAPRLNTWYPVALANALRGADLDAGNPDIFAQFNPLLDSDPGCLTGLDWWYGIGGPPPPGGIPFYDTLIHELAHGLGFITIVDLATGARVQGLDDHYMLFLEDHSSGKTWPQMNNAERALSAKDNGDLHWSGPAVQAASTVLSAGRHTSGHVRMYAPSTLATGSSVAHWDTALLSDEMMEPFATPAPFDLLTTRLMKDIGWTLPTTACLLDLGTACLQLGRFEVTASWQTASPASGAGQAMGFGGQRTENVDSVFFWFFGASNFEIGVKVLNACPVNNKFWVFISGLTDQGWTVTVRDSKTGAVKTFSNAVGHLSQTFADTSAFACP